MNYQEFIQAYGLSLNPQQEAAVTSTNRGQTLLLAVPGSGKTTVLLARMAYLTHCCNVPGPSILALSYSRAAAQELEERYLSTYETPSGTPVFSTINAFCAAVLRYSCRLKKVEQPKLVADNSSAIRHALHQSDADSWPSERLVRALAGAVTRVKNQCISPVLLSVPELAEEYPSVGFSEFYRRYTRDLADHGQMDFDDQMVMALSILKEDRMVLDYVRRRFRHIFLDEAQDTSAVQFAVLHLAAAEADSLLVAGDDDQSIYGFRGADPSGLRNFQAQYPHAEILYLESNYRSLPVLVEGANRFIAGNTLRYAKTAVPVRKEEGDGSISTVFKSSMQSLYEEVWSMVSEAILEHASETLAVMARNNFALLPVALQLDRMGLNVRRRDNFRSFFENASVSALLGALTLSQEQWDIDALLDARRLFGIYLTGEQVQELRKAYQDFPGDKSNFSVLDWAAYLFRSPAHLQRGISRAQQVIRLIRTQRPYQALRDLLSAYSSFCPDPAEGTDRPENSVPSFGVYHGVLLHLASQFQTMPDFLSSMLRYRQIGGNTMDISSNVTITTIHSAKGMEFDFVILLDMLDGVLPRYKEGDGSSLESREEDARLFYVACTRARNHLAFLISPNFFGVRSRPSPYLERFTGQKPEDALA